MRTDSAEAGALLADLRRTEFARLDASGHVYLDYTGAGLYAASQLEEHLALLRGGVTSSDALPSTRTATLRPPTIASFGSADRSQCSFAELSRNTV